MPLKEGKSDEEDEIVSFEAFCHDTAAGDTGKSDALTLNDNVNYHLFYENRDQSGEEALNNQGFKETSLSGLSQKFAHKRNVPKFYQPGGRCAFLGRFNNNSSARSATTADDEGYQRFSTNRGAWSQLPKIGSGVLIILIVCILCVAVWWGVWGIVGGPWGEEHYRRLWEKAHPNHNQQTHYSPSVIVHQQLERLDTLEPKYHDHNNLSTKNKASALENGKKQKIEIVRKNIALLGGLDISDTPPVPDRKQCKVVLDDLKFDCFPQGTATEEACKDRGCCWMPPTQYSLNYQLPQGTLGIPYCFYPPNYASYKYVNITEDDRGIHALLQRQFRSPYSNDIDLVKLEIEFLAYPGMRMKLYDAEKARYEPPYPEVAPPRFKHNSWAVRVEIDPLKMGFKVIRKVDNTTIFNTQNIGGFIFSDKFLQISSLLPSENIYGLGEHRARFPLNIQWQKFTLFNHDTRPNENTNLYGSHPFYLIMEHSGLSHGVLLLNSNAMDVILQPAPAITFRTIGGILDFFLFHGTTPKDVVAQFTYLVGRPVMPNYWALGFHLCKYNYGSLNETREVWKRNVDAGIPFDVQWNDIDYMNNSNDFTYDKVLYADLPKFVEEVHKIGMHYVPIIDAGVSAAEIPGTYPPYDRGLDMNIFIKHQNGLPFVGKVWNKASTVWPDFTHPNSSEYWLEMLKNLHNDIPFDGIWLDMNEPSNFLSGPLHGSCAPENLEYMPGVAGGNGLRSGTICMEAEHYLGSHYNLHNIHSLTEVVATEYALSEIMPQRRPFIISRSSFIGLGLYGGHWSGDNYSDWYDMKMSIPEMLMFSLFGVPLMGSDICGFGGNTTAELCMRWMELGAFYPFSRNHNTETGLPQDPVAMGPEVVAASKRALRIRYTLLPYLYTLFWKVHEYGETVASPTFFVFPKDRETYELDQQFMWGEEILIAPILDPGVKSVRAYLPDYTWYRFNGLSRIKKTGWVTLNEGETVMLKGAVVYIMQEPPNYGPVNTQTTRSQPMQLVVALHKLNANGMLYWDDGENPRAIQEGKYSRIHFYAQNNFMSNQVIWWGYGVPPISRISFLSVRMPAVKYVYINNDTHTNFTFDPIAKVLHVIDLNLDMNKHFTISYHDGKDRHVYNPPLGWKPDYE